MVGEEVCRNPDQTSSGGGANPLSCCSSSSSYLSLSPASANGGEYGLDGMELEAARALACFSRAAVRENSVRRRRLKNRSPARDWRDSTLSRDLTSVPENVSHENVHPPDNNAIKVTDQEERIKVEQISEIPPPSSNCSLSYLSCSRRKIRQSLTEAEREARRMHRVLANRVSARQTIRRRQALRDDLTKKVCELSLGNQNMKMEKEQVMEEYMSLKKKNKQLKDELAMAFAYNIMGSETTSAPPEASSERFFMNIKPPFMPGTWPPWPVIAAHAELCYEESDAYEAAEPWTPLFVPQCSWFCSLLHQMSASCHLISDKLEDKEVDFLCGSSKATVVEEKTAARAKPARKIQHLH